MELIFTYCISIDTTTEDTIDKVQNNDNKPNREKSDDVIRYIIINK